MNNSFLRDNDDGIGIDPTTLDVIETLDSPGSGGEDNNKKVKKVKPPKEKKEKKVNPDAKPGDGSKKFLLIVLVVALIIGVAYGIYWYLSLGTKSSNKTTDKKYTLEDKYIVVGDLLSDKVTDYGTFPGIDIKTCTLNTSEVNSELIGEYDYSITCDGTKYSAKVHVVEEPVLNVKPMIAVASVDGYLDVSSLYTTTEEYTPVQLTDEELTEILSSSGIKKVEFKLTDSKGLTATVYGFVYVLDNEADKILNCYSDDLTANDKTYTIDDAVYFDTSGNKMADIKTYHYTLNSDELSNLLESISEDGTATFNSVTGYALIDRQNYTLDIVKENSDTSLYDRYDDVKTYFTDSKSYTCSGDNTTKED